MFIETQLQGQHLYTYIYTDRLINLFTDLVPYIYTYIHIFSNLLVFHCCIYIYIYLYTYNYIFIRLRPTVGCGCECQAWMDIRHQKTNTSQSNFGFS